MTLSQAEEKQLRKAMSKLTERSQHDEQCRRYYEGRQRIRHMGLAVPPELQDLELVVNWPRVVVDTIEERQDVRGLQYAGDKQVVGFLRRVMDVNELDADLCMWKRDRLIYGRGFLIVGSGDTPLDLPIVQVASPREVYASIDKRNRRVAWAARILRFGEPEDEQVVGYLYTPDTTVVADLRGGRWSEVDRDDHGLGVVPVVPSYNRRMTGDWNGQSEMEDIAGITDAAVRALTDLQAAVETNAVPKRIIAGAKRSDFKDLDGWATYLRPFLTLADPNAKAFQLDAANLANFHETIMMYGKLAASVTGFPARFFGLITTNPPAEGAIRAEESKLVKRVERANVECGAALSRALTIAAQIAGYKVGFGAVNVRWHDPATPTFSQKADAIQKLAGGRPLLSREGAWDELGWDDARKDAERANFAAEFMDVTLDELEAKASAYGDDS